MTRIALLPIALMIVAALGAAPAGAREVRGVEFADYVDVADWQMPLRLSGAAVIERSYLPFYVVALYVKRERVDADPLQRGLGACRIVLHWLTPSLDAKTARAYWRAEFDKRIADPMARQRLGPSLERVITALGAAKRGDEVTLDYQPDRGLRVTRSGERPTQFAGLELNRVVLGLWFDPVTPADVRTDLFEGLDPVEPAK